MAKIGVRVEATEESTQQRDFGNVPNGIYKLEITASDVPIKNEGTSQQSTMVNVTIDIIEPEDFKGRKLFANYNVEHPNSQAQEIGQRQFSCLLRALGMTDSPEESDELHFIAFTAQIGMGKDSKEKNSDGSPKYAARNEIKKYFYPDQGDVPEPAVDAVQPAAHAARAQAPANDNRQAAAAAKPAGAKPWGARK
jgi:hypothetical protein